MSARNRPENKTARRHARIIRHAEASEARVADLGVKVTMGLIRLFNGWHPKEAAKPTGPRVGRLDQHRSVHVKSARVEARPRKRGK
jgi:hypothetical protein